MMIRLLEASVRYSPKSDRLRRYRIVQAYLRYRVAPRREEVRRHHGLQHAGPLCWGAIME
jgi:hypothetical protein